MKNIEIERKFIVEEIPLDLGKYKKFNIQQGYLSISEQNEVRIRKKEDKYWLTFKDAGVLARKEIEIEISANQFNSLWDATDGKRIFKKRYVIEFNKVEIELDLFEKKLQGLILAEVEFETILDSEKFSPPFWFGKEVTNNREFNNSSLALKGRP